MKKMIGLLAMAAAMLSLTGCGVMYNQSVSSAPLSVNSEAYLEPKLEVGEKVSGQVKVTRILFFTFGTPYRFADGVVYGGAPRGNDDAGLFARLFGSAAPLEQAKAAAALRAVEKGKADVLVAPRYTIDQKNFWIFSQMAVKVEGYSGRVKGFRQVPAEAAQRR